MYLPLLRLRINNVFAGLKLRPEIQALMNKTIHEPCLNKNTPHPSTRKDR